MANKLLGPKPTKTSLHSCLESCQSKSNRNIVPLEKWTLQQMKARITSNANLTISSSHRTTKNTLSTKCLPQTSLTEGNRKRHIRTKDALQKSEEDDSTVTKKHTKFRSAQQRNVRIQHNLNKTDKTLTLKDQSVIEKWYETTADRLGTLHETVDKKKNITSPYRNIPYDKQDTKESRGFRNDFKRTQQRQYRDKARHEAQESDNCSANESDQVDSLN